MLFYERFFTASLQLILKMGSYFVGVKIKKLHHRSGLVDHNIIAVLLTVINKEKSHSLATFNRQKPLDSSIRASFL